MTKEIKYGSPEDQINNVTIEEALKWRQEGKRIIEGRRSALWQLLMKF